MNILIGLGLLFVSLVVIGWLARKHPDPLARFLSGGEIVGALTCVVLTFAFVVGLFMIGVGLHGWLGSITQDALSVLAILCVALVLMFRITHAQLL